ncbi:hypothetical protein NE237_012844 [Protea cynaroides]|uniref:Uncharacterized protein n=1 Tax=Protea cynaroides TaxID=273540 RepID=A0A9Q0GXI8_9MAGN|nr:hypothetical protein NE237_012844 [Protea cynaroides]
MHAMLSHVGGTNEAGRSLSLVAVEAPTESVGVVGEQIRRTEPMSAVGVAGRQLQQCIKSIQFTASLMVTIGTGVNEEGQLLWVLTALNKDVGYDGYGVGGYVGANTWYSGTIKAYRKSRAGYVSGPPPRRPWNNQTPYGYGDTASHGTTTPWNAAGVGSGVVGMGVV